MKTWLNKKEYEIQKMISDQLNEFGLPKAEQLYPANLSGGMQKRVGLARALMMHPELILYDEPTAGLDPSNTRKIQEHILKLKATGITSILVTHDMPTAFAVCDKMSFILDGKIAFEGSLDEIHQRIAAVGYDTDKIKANDEAYAKLDECCKYEREQ